MLNRFCKDTSYEKQFGYIHTLGGKKLYMLDIDAIECDMNQRKLYEHNFNEIFFLWELKYYKPGLTYNIRPHKFLCDPDGKPYNTMVCICAIYDGKDHNTFKEPGFYLYSCNNKKAGWVSPLGLMKYLHKIRGLTIDLNEKLELDNVSELSDPAFITCRKIGDLPSATSEHLQSQYGTPKINIL